MLKFILILSLFVNTNFADVETYRLPNNVIPTRYLLTIQPNIQKETFNGSVVIDLRVNENSKTITLHKRHLKILEDTVKIIESDGTEIKVVNCTKDKINETFTIKTETNLIKNKKYHLIIGTFYGFTKGHFNGFYSISYFNKAGDERRLFLTDFEPNDARQAFPCFDEPALKATFRINIIRTKEYNSVSNEELESTIFLGNDLFQDVYKETPKMSTYLVAFAVSDFKHVNLTSKYKIYGRPEAIEENSFSKSLHALKPLTEALEEYTGIKYNMKKIDHFAVPENGFMSSAMENWGLITYREQALACSNSSTDVEIQMCTGTIAHELTHQWFGNLVGPLWWDSIWLNEGFASYLQYYISSVVYPSRRYMELYMERFHGALSLDSRDYYKDCIVGDSSLKLLNGKGTAIVYAKGSAVIRMMEHFLTPALFRKGLQIYLNAKQYGSAQASDLYNGLQTAVNEAQSNHLLGNLSVATILNNWINEPGYPVVTVERNYENGNVQFSQKKYQSQISEPDEENGEFWHVPVNYVFEKENLEKLSKTSANFWLSEKNITLTNQTIDGWILVNIRQTGFYRVNYDLENWQRLIDFMKNDDFKIIPVENRAQLIDDAFNLAEAKHLPFEIPFKLSQYLVKEKSYLPIKTFLNHQYQISEYFADIFKRRKFDEIKKNWNYTITHTQPEHFVALLTAKNFVVEMLTPLYHHLGSRQRINDTYFDRILRPHVLREICGHIPHCRDSVLEDFENLQYHNASLLTIAPNMQRLVFCEGAKTSKGKDFLLNLYSQVEDAEVKIRIESGLNCYQSTLYYG